MLFTEVQLREHPTAVWSSPKSNFVNIRSPTSWRSYGRLTFTAVQLHEDPTAICFSVKSNTMLVFYYLYSLKVSVTHAKGNISTTLCSWVTRVDLGKTIQEIYTVSKATYDFRPLPYMPINCESSDFFVDFPNVMMSKASSSTSAFRITMNFTITTI